MKFTSVKFTKYKCFQNDWAGFDEVKPVTVIIGRNNTGKSHLLHLVEGACGNDLLGRGWYLKVQGKLDESSLARQFNKGTSGGELGGRWWEDHGNYFVDTTVLASVSGSGKFLHIELPDSFDLKVGLRNPNVPRVIEERSSKIKNIIQLGNHTFSGLNFRRLLADRDVKPEPETRELELSVDGSGATNIIRKYINSSNEAYPRNLIQKDLLASLNQVFAEDGQFSEIQIQHHDDIEDVNSQGPTYWEVYLGEKHKSLIPLSSSGSGLKTIILVLLNLLIVPQFEGKSKSSYVFAFEELENNLHPALLRRLFYYIEDYAVNNGVSIFLTTHSSVALDLFGSSPNAQLIRVTHDGRTANARTISAHFDQLSVIAELGAKPSDLLQANGIVWVEGPSDRLYINKWIDLFSEGKWKEGRDYQCAFYGGALLARVEISDPDDNEDQLVNLFQINPNLVFVCDGDRTAKIGAGSRLKKRVRKIKKQVERIPDSFIWITEAKEIENYLPGDVLGNYIGSNMSPKDPGQYERFFPTSNGNSYMEQHLGRKTVDKVELALKTVPLMDKEKMSSRFDLAKGINGIVERIEMWNK